MQQQGKEISRLKRPFVAAGVAAGAVGSGWYLYRNIAGLTPVPDPLWTRFVNVALIMFSAVYLANLLRRFVEMATKGRGGKARKGGS